MNARRKRSGPRSSTNEPPEPDHVYFIDACLGFVTVPNRMRADGMRVELLRDHFDAAEEDPKWIPDVGSRGWVALTQDYRMTKKAGHLASVAAAELAVFTVSGASQRGEVTAEAIVTARRRMEGILHATPRPFVARIYNDGSVEVLFRARELRREYGRPNPKTSE